MSSENNVKGLVRAPTMGRLRMLAATAPAIFIAHALEEGPGFVQWFNAHVARGITPGLFWTVNLVGLALTLAVCAIAWNAPSGTSDVLLLAWLSFLFGANAALHMVAALVDRAYVPWSPPWCSTRRSMSCWCARPFSPGESAGSR